MYCTRCGVDLKETDRFCSQCGCATARVSPSMPGLAPRLSRPREEARIAGVCAGFARYLGVDVTLVRILWLVLIFLPPTGGLIAYLICWIVMPKDPLMIAAPMRRAGDNTPAPVII